MSIDCTMYITMDDVRLFIGTWTIYQRLFINTKKKKKFGGLPTIPIHKTYIGTQLGRRLLSFSTLHTEIVTGFFLFRS